MKKRLTSAPILAHPLFDRPYTLYTDASAGAFAAVLTQLWTSDDYADTAQETTSQIDLKNATALTVESNEKQWPEMYKEDGKWRAIYESVRTGKHEKTFEINNEGVLLFHGPTGTKICLPFAVFFVHFRPLFLVAFDRQCR